MSNNNRAKPDVIGDLLAEATGLKVKAWEPGKVYSLSLDFPLAGLKNAVTNVGLEVDTLDTIPVEEVGKMKGYEKPLVASSADPDPVMPKIPDDQMALTAVVAYIDTRTPDFARNLARAVADKRRGGEAQKEDRAYNIAVTTIEKQIRKQMQEAGAEVSASPARA